MEVGALSPGAPHTVLLKVEWGGSMGMMSRLVAP